MHHHFVEICYAIVCVNADGHGKDGPITLTESTGFPKTTAAFLKSAEQLGYPIVDSNACKELGMSYIYITFIEASVALYTYMLQINHCDSFLQCTDKPFVTASSNHWQIQDFTKGGGGTGKQFMIVCITKDWIKYSGIDLWAPE